MLSDLMRRVSSWDPVFISASAPCQAYSTTDIHHLSDAPRRIPLMRYHLRTTGRLYALENVKGAAPDLLDSAQLLYGAFFGLRVDRPRFFETSFDLVIDEYIRAPGLALRRDTCLGPLRRWRRLDPFGRPEMTECCAGNIIPVQGKAPVGCTLEQSAAAMGLDASHMPYERLAQAIPPVYEQLVFTQACMAACLRDYGVPSITFDEMLSAPEASRRTLEFWLHGPAPRRPMPVLHWPLPPGRGRLRNAGGRVRTVPRREPWYDGIWLRYDGLWLRYDGLWDGYDGLWHGYDRLRLRHDGLRLRHDRLWLRHDRLRLRNDGLRVWNAEQWLRSDGLSLRSDGLRLRDDGLRLWNDRWLWNDWLRLWNDGLGLRNVGLRLWNAEHWLRNDGLRLRYDYLRSFCVGRTGRKDDHVVPYSRCRRAQ